MRRVGWGVVGDREVGLASGEGKGGEQVKENAAGKSARGGGRSELVSRRSCFRYIRYIRYIGHIFSSA